VLCTHPSPYSFASFCFAVEFPASRLREAPYAASQSDFHASFAPWPCTRARKIQSADKNGSARLYMLVNGANRFSENKKIHGYRYTIV